MPAGCAQRSLKPEMILMGCHVWSSGSGSAQYFVGTWVTAGPPWLAPLLAMMQDRQGEHCSALNHVKGPCGDRQTCDLELEKACDSQALGIIHRDGSKRYGNCQGQSICTLAALISQPSHRSSIDQLNRHIITRSGFGELTCG